ncbi:MAG: hypothetical protein JXP48_13540 [Acidobacteria bacterium]|nr:hypothetical protein [Acidobacteriota bacterium]
MARSRRRLFLSALCLAAGILGAGLPRAQQLGRVSSDHVIVQMPAERELLGRQLIGDLERCYAYMNRSIGGALPRQVAVTLDWTRAEAVCNRRAGHITIGMGRPEASGDKELLFHAIAREMARLGLLNLSEGAAREDTEFLFEGMIEILVHEFDHSSRSLESAWAISKLLLEMDRLGLARQRTWSDFSGGVRNHRSAAPGVTFFKTFRDLQGRERPVKFFESLKKRSLLKAMETAFKAPGDELERVWLDRVREYRIPEEILIHEARAPRLVRVEFRPADAVLRLVIEDADRDLSTVFVRDEGSGSVLQARAETENGVPFFAVSLPAGAPAGAVTIVAVDEAGNLRSWNETPVR